MRALLAAAVLALLTVAPACAQRPRPSILQASGETVRVRLLAAGARPLANAPVEIWSDNGIRCFRAPCPTNGTSWQGRTDAAGIVVVPRKVLQASTTITSPGYEGDLVQGARPAPDGTWKMVLTSTGDAHGQGEARPPAR